MLEHIQLKQKLVKADYKKAMDKLELKAAALQREAQALGIPVMIAFEGWDAAGKGTLINRFTLALDARGEIKWKTPFGRAWTDSFSDSRSTPTIEGDYAYVAAYDAGLRVVDVFTPTNPTEVGYYDTPGYARGVAVAGNYAYVADGGSGLQVVDVSDPERPLQKAKIPTRDMVRSIAQTGDVVAIAEGSAGVRLHPIQSPDRRHPGIRCNTGRIRCIDPDRNG